MLSNYLLFTLANAFLSLANPAEIITNNPTDIVLRADFPTANSQSVVGIIQFYSLNGTAKVHVDLTGLPKNSGLFSYHIHEGSLIQSNSKCEETGDHFNPLNAPKDDCDSLIDDSYCQIGDLSGKHGLINTTCFETFYYDPYLSLDPNHPQYIGNKALNIHLLDKNNERLACANIRPSKEPEDLLLLNKETEREEVKKYEELSGVKIESYEDVYDESAEDEEDFDYEEYEEEFYDDDDDALNAMSTNSVDDEPTEVEAERPQLESRTDDVEKEVAQVVETTELENVVEEESVEEVTESTEEESAEEEESVEEVAEESTEETESVEEVEEAAEESDSLEDLVEKDVSNSIPVMGNYSYNISDTTDDSQEENSANNLKLHSIIGCFGAILVALLI